MRHIVDGTSTTMLFLEMIPAPSEGQGANVDRRGRIWFPVIATHEISTFMLPNSTRCTGAASQNRALGCGPDVSGNCVDQPEVGLPCVKRTGQPNDHVLGSRSYHPSGVQAAFCDGAVRFMPDSVELAVWRALSTRDGGEITTAL
jgi:prepilin-type processing-associated H-X9-DG protein